MLHGKPCCDDEPPGILREERHNIQQTALGGYSSINTGHRQPPLGVRCPKPKNKLKNYKP